MPEIDSVSAPDKMYRGLLEFGERLVLIGLVPGRTSSSLPPAKRKVRVHRPASSRLCVTSTEVSPCASCSRSIKPNTRSADAPSKSPVGSSASSNCGFVTSARASATRCCSPPLNSPGLMRCPVGQAGLCQPFCCFLHCVSPVNAARQQRHGYVFLRRKLRQQVVKLPYVPDLLIAKTGRLTNAQLSYLSCGAVYRPCRWSIKGAQHVQKCAFTASGLSHNGNQLAALDFKR